MLQRVKILFSKQLYKACAKVIVKGKVLAKKYDKPTSLLEFLQWENQLLLAQSYANISTFDVRVLFDERIKAINDMKVINEYTRIQSLLNSSTSKMGSSRKSSVIEMYKRTLKLPEVQHYYRLELFEPLMIALSFYYRYYNLTNNVLKLSEYATKRIEACEKHMHHIELNPLHYVASLADASTAYLKSKQYDLVPELLPKFDSIQTSSAVNRERIFCLRNYAELHYLLGIEDYIQLEKLVSKLEKELKTRQEMNPNMFSIALFFAIGKCAFALGKYKIAKQKLNHILMTMPESIDVDYHIFSRLLLLLIHVETNENELLAFDLNSIKRFLDKKQKLYGLEKALIKFFRKKVNLISPDSLIRGYLELQKDIKKCYNDPLEKTTVFYFDFLKWVESKLKQK